MEPDRTIVTYVGLAIPFAGLAVGTLLTYVVTKHAREEREMLNRERLAAIEKGLDVPLFDLKVSKKRTSPLSSALQTVGLQPFGHGRTPRRARTANDRGTRPVPISRSCRRCSRRLPRSGSSAASASKSSMRMAAGPGRTGRREPPAGLPSARPRP